MKKRTRAALASILFGDVQAEVRNAQIASFMPTESYIQKLIVGIEPVQDLHGYDNPWPAGGWKNKIPVTSWYVVGYTETHNGVTFEILQDGGIKVSGINDGTNPSDFYLSSYSFPPITNAFYVPNGQYTMSAWISGTNTTSVHFVFSGGGGNNGFPYGDLNYNTSTTGTVTNDEKPFSYLIIRVPKNAPEVNATIYVQLETGDTATSYAPYSNICPITGWSAADIFREASYDPTASPYVTVSFGQTVYGGTLDVLKGKLYARPYYSSYNGETLVGPWVSSMDKYEEGATPTTGAEVLDLGGTITEITLTPTQIATIQRQVNYVWADCGPIIELIS